MLISMIFKPFFFFKFARMNFYTLVICFLITEREIIKRGGEDVPPGVRKGVGCLESLFAEIYMKSSKRVRKHIWIGYTY